jgi:glycine betaine catabolism B
MMTYLDRVLDRITMYRLVLYVLLGLVGWAAVLSSFSLLPFSPVSLLVSAAFLAIVCWAVNAILAWVFDVPTNVESAAITALILALIIDPARSPTDLQFLGWAATLAMASKYILALNNKHLFNPAAIAVVTTAFALGEPASWWVGTGSMLPVVLLGGLLVVRKVRQEEMAGSFLAAALVTVSAVSYFQGNAVPREVQQLLVASPLFFFASIMLTEPLTAPPTRGLKRAYAVLTGVLIAPQIHAGHLYSTPELALVVGNVFSYLVSPKHRVVLKLKKKLRVSRDMVDFVLAPSHRLAFAPGQYIECTLAHPHPDARGNRRYFTLASSPTEGAIHLGVRFYEHGSSFKKALYAMDGRTRMIGGQIAGDFTLPHDRAQKLVFIAGGIGITPYRSMLKYLLDTKQRRDIVLIYATRTADEIIYRDVLGEAQTRLGIRALFTLTDTAATPRDWAGHRGRIDERMIVESVPDYRERTFYISGPPDMVRAHERVLRDLGVRRDRIKKDFFPGLV